MGLLALFACLLGYIYFLSSKFKISYNLAIPITTSLIISIIFIAALVQKLEPVTYSLYIIGITLFIYSIASILKDKHSLRTLFPNELIFLLIIIALYYLRVFHAYFITWDDFSHWGIISKEVYHYNGFVQTHQETSMLPSLFSYTRISALFNYFITKSIGYTEGNNLFATGLLSILLTSVLLTSRTTWQNSFLFLGALATTTLYTPALRSLYIDGTVGIAFGCLLAIYILEENKIKSLLYIAPIVFILPNIKEVGFWFAYAGLASIGIHLLFSNNIKQNKSSFLILLILITLPYLSYKLWALYLGNFSLPSGTMKLSFWELFQKISPLSNSQHDQEIILGVFKGILKFLIKEGSIVLYLLIAISIYFIKKHRLELTKSYKIIFFTLLLCFIAYLGFRLSLYFTHFSFKEIQKGSSYVRYYGAFTIAFAFIAAAYTNLAITKIPVDQLLRYKYMGMFLNIIFFSIVVFCIYERPSTVFSTERVMVQQVAQQLREFRHQELKAYTIYNNFNALNCYQLNYELAPTGIHEFNACNAQVGALWPNNLIIDENNFKILSNVSFNQYDHLRSNPNIYDILYIPNTLDTKGISLFQIKAKHKESLILALKGENFIFYLPEEVLP